MITLDLTDLTPYTSLRSSVVGAAREAASVMLSRFHDESPTRGLWTPVDEGKKIHVQLIWQSPSEDEQAAHANEKDATEYAAYAVAMAVADRLGFRVTGRLHQGSGADWVMVPKGEPNNDFYKLEVSGMARVSTENPESRLTSKVDQGRGGDYNRPGMAVVARFEDALILSEGWR